MDNFQDLFLENREINKREIGQKAIKLISKPRRLMVILTAKCNIACIMCERKVSKSTLPERFIRCIIDIFPYLELVAWQGGEVFLVDYFKDLFQEAMRYPHLVQEINTNGLLLNKEWVKMIGRANTRLIFSIDSTEKEAYEYIRKGAKFENLIENINLIREIEKSSSNVKLDKTINIVIMRSNYRTLEAFIDFALEYKFSGLNFLNMIGDVCPQENIFRPPDIEALNYLKSNFPFIIKRAKSCGINLSHELSPFLYEDNNPYNVSEPSNRDGLFCVMPWKSLFIDGSQEGTVYPECLCRRPIGNIFKNSLAEIWDNEEMQNYRKKIARGDLQNWCNSKCVKGLINKDFLQEYSANNKLYC